MSVFKKLLLKDYVTLAGTITGTLAIILAFLGVFYSESFFILTATFSWAVAMGCDLFDGWVARKLNQVNQIGKEIDSLSDAVSFVVAPSIIIFSASLNGEFASLNGRFSTSPFVAEIVIIGVLIFVFCGIIRLAWFNVEDKGEGYTGLVTPMSAAFLVAFFVSHYHYNRLGSQINGWPEYYHLFSPLANIFGNILTVTVFMIILGMLNLAPWLKYSSDMQKKRGAWVYILIIIGIFMVIMIVLGSIFSGFNRNLAIIVGHFFSLGFLFCIIGYIVHGFINYLTIKRRHES